ncbi:MAG TPA: hypothetical protein VFX63_03480, partial [Pyrinomonadaceae bacterium]|nr:hypothetical protein [Pyrinomonadaceae bacterium]
FLILLRERSGSGDEQHENEQGKARIPIHGKIFLSLEIGDADDLKSFSRGGAAAQRLRLLCVFVARLRERSKK